MPEVEAVALDAFGTLCFIGERTDPLNGLLRQTGVPRSAARRTFMTGNVPLTELLHSLGGGHAFDVAAVEQAVQREVESVRLFSEVEETLERLRRRGLKLAVVSNLARPYAEPVRPLLGERIDQYVWSFEVGAVKPEAAIFVEVCRRLECRPEAVLMMGDSLTSDVAGAGAFGMQAVHLDRAAGASGPGRVRSLLELPALLGIV